MKAILFNTTKELQSFNNNEAKCRSQDLGMVTKYVYANDGLYLKIHTDKDGNLVLPQHTEDYDLVDYTPPITEEDI